MKKLEILTCNITGDGIMVEEDSAKSFKKQKTENLKKNKNNKTLTTTSCCRLSQNFVRFSTSICIMKYH